MTNAYFSDARWAFKHSREGVTEPIGFGLTRTRVGICSAYRWCGLPLFVLQYNPNFKKKLFIGGLPILPWRRAEVREPIAGRYALEAGRPSRVYINVGSLPFFDNRSGIPRVAKELASHGLQCRDAWVLPVYADPLTGEYRYAAQWARERGFNVSRLEALHAFCVDGDAPVTFAAGDWLVHTMINPNEIDFEADQFAQLRRFGVKVGFVLHDLIAERRPDCFKPRDAANFSRWLRMLPVYDGIFAVSKATLTDYRAWCEENSAFVNPQQIQGWFHLGADFTPGSRELTESHRKVLNQLQDRPFFLQVSTIEPRKGHAQLLDAFDLLWKDGIDLSLVFVGRRGWLVRALCRRISRHPELNRRLFWFSGLSDAALNALYDRAQCVVVASEAEGYGLSVVEGANHQKPLLVRDIPAFREVAPQGAHFFTGLKPEALADAVRRVQALIREDRIPSYSLRPQPWAQSFSDFFSLSNLNNENKS